MVYFVVVLSCPFWIGRKSIDQCLEKSLFVLLALLYRSKTSRNCTVISTVHNTITDISCVKSGVDQVINCALYNFFHRITAMNSYLLVLLCQVTSQFVIKAIQFCQHNYKILNTFQMNFVHHNRPMGVLYMCLK